MHSTKVSFFNLTIGIKIGGNYTLKTHNLFILLIFSGLKIKFDNEKAINKGLAKANSLLFTAWDESVRYKPCGFMLPNDVKTLITLISQTNGLIEWIEQN